MISRQTPQYQNLLSWERRLSILNLYPSKLLTKFIGGILDTTGQKAALEAMEGVKGFETALQRYVHARLNCIVLIDCVCVYTPDICHNHHNRWLCKKFQSSVKNFKVEGKETNLILHKICSFAKRVLSYTQSILLHSV